MIKKEDFERITLARSIIFFLDVFLALMIITGSFLLIKSDIGKLSLLFGGFMLMFSVAARLLKHW